jgi:hypothetical protein
MEIAKQGICSICNGTGRMSTPDRLRVYAVKYGWYGYRKEDDCCDCTNCGGQLQWGKPTGMVNLRVDGTPCVHEYTSKNISNCYNGYTCKHCGDYHTIDSGD